MIDTDTLMAWVKTHFVRKRDLVNSTVKVGALALTPKSYTIAAGVVTLTPGTGVAFVDTEGAAIADDLDTINGGEDYQLLVVRQTDNGRDVTLKDGTGNLNLAGDFVMSNIADMILLLKIGVWREISRSDNA